MSSELRVATLKGNAFPRILPFAIFLTGLAISSWWGTAAQSSFDSRWLVVLRGAAVAAALVWFWREYGELHVHKLRLTDTAVAIASGFAVFVVWIYFDKGWAVIGHSQGFDPTDAQGAIDIPLVVLRLMSLAIVVPIMEELFWRSFLLRWIDSRNFLAVDPRRISRLAFVLTAILFASEHSLWFAGLIAGLVYNWCYMRTGNLWTPILSHMITNSALGVWILATRNWNLW